MFQLSINISETGVNRLDLGAGEAGDVVGGQETQK